MSCFVVVDAAAECQGGDQLKAEKGQYRALGKSPGSSAQLITSRSSYGASDVLESSPPWGMSV